MDKFNQCLKSLKNTLALCEAREEAITTQKIDGLSAACESLGFESGTDVKIGNQSEEEFAQQACESISALSQEMVNELEEAYNEAVQEGGEDLAMAYSFAGECLCESLTEEAVDWKKWAKRALAADIIAGGLLAAHKMHKENKALKGRKMKIRLFN